MRWHKRRIAGCANLWNGVLVAAWLCSAVLISPAARAQNDCKPLYDANDRLLTGPSHTYQTETGHASSSEVIYSGGSIYVMTKGKWTKSPMSAAAVHAQEEQNKKTAKNVSCKHLRDESVNGEPATVYNMHSETGDIKSDAQTWISKSKGLLLRQEEDVDIGGGDKRHFSIRFEYTNVRAPAVSP